MENIGMAHVHTSLYKGCNSIILENEWVKVEVVPSLGGKIVSILYKPSGKEWMLDSGERQLEQPMYGSTFTDWDMSGWDECFPTIIACPSGVDNEISLPDHGELWALPWEYVIEKNEVVCTVKSPKLPYRFTRRISFVNNDRIRLGYSAENNGEKPIPFLWVPHPQFAITESTRILLPDSIQQVLCVDGGAKLKIGESYLWYDISLVSPEVTGDARKLYYDGKVPLGWSGLYEELSRNYLIMSVPPDKVPYIGVWIDEGLYNDRVTCALEPSIGYYDSLETAMGNQTAQIIPARNSFEWYLELTIGVGDWSKVI
ncbi:DUF5107 domain-containing protein [Paenibacillus sp. Soil787]|uniref:DUF5107 domain-containing protein n=1 Tax=Paenibacillus sp. Soil787 TaxID=1736411 RepID=UPI0006FF1B46|nr:DUF5107 domain-containing protein [Paenibacillus sp. Soil787]KRF44169.1 hypothetical protein ASG93_04485 [Paenibacillus sp. Soil787]